MHSIIYTPSYPPSLPPSPLPPPCQLRQALSDILGIALDFCSVLTQTPLGDGTGPDLARIHEFKKVFLH